MTGLFNGHVPVALDAIFADADLLDRKLARADRSDENRAMALALLEWRNARQGLGLSRTAVEAIANQLRVETAPPGLRRLLGWPERVRHIAVMQEAAARDALALASVAALEPTVALAREYIEDRVTRKAWALPLQRLCKAIAPDRDIRSTVGPWRKDLAEYSGMVGSLAVAMVKLLLGEVLAPRAAETVDADVLLDFAARAYPATTANLDGEKLTTSLGVGLSGETPTLQTVPAATICTTTEPPQERAA